MRLALILLTALCVTGAGAQDRDVKAAEDKTGQRGSANAPSRQFVQRAAQIHMTHAHIGEMAKNRAKSEEVKEFGEQLAERSRRAYERLSQIATQFAFVVPKGIDDQHQKRIQRLEKLSADEFDRQFKQYLTSELRRDADWFQQQSNKLEHADLKEYASAQYAAVEEQYRRAQAPDMRHQTSAASAAGGSLAGESEYSRADRSTLPVEGAIHEAHATVTAFEPGKSLTVKFRHRIGEHRYELAASNFRAEVPDDLNPGDAVIVKEHVDQNGFGTIEVRRDGTAGGTYREGPQSATPQRNQ
jgi:putative membrane protein